VHSTPGWAGNPALPPEKTLAPSSIRSSPLPLSFEANQGQVDEQVKYLARGQGYTLFLTPGAAVLGLRSEGAGKPTEWLRLALHGAAAAPAITGEEPLPGQSNYFVGNDPARWRTHIPTFARVRYQQVYPGVDLIYYGRQGRLENDFEITAGTNPKVISWRLEGAEGIRVDSNGDLVLTMGGSEVRLQRPRAYQLDGEQERQIPVRYRVHGRKVGFALGKYDRQQKLVIDPVLTYSTLLGGNGGDIGYGIAVDSLGDAYVTGITGSVNFPTTSGAYQTTYTGDGDVFVTKFNPAGTGVLFSTYLGGTGINTPSGLLLDSSGNIHIVGSTSSVNFPTTATSPQPAFGGGISDAFLVELKADGASLIYSTYLGGSGADYGMALTLDAAGNAYITGYTLSIDFPTANPIQLGNDGLADAFVAEINAGGTSLVYSTYLGGTNNDYGTGIAVDSTGDIYVAGYTFSTNFPTQIPYQSTNAGGSDIFVTELNPASATLLFSTYLGGSSNDTLTAFALDSQGDMYLAGNTQSPNFPVTPNAFQSLNKGAPDGTFITKVAPGFATLVFSTYLGGSSTNNLNAMALDAAGNIYVTGFTNSTDFPLVDAFQQILGIAGAGSCGSTSTTNVGIPVVCADAFAAKFDRSGIPIYSSFLGGNSTDSGQAIVVDSSGSVYVTGSTESPNFPVTPGTYQWAFLGSDTFSNAFVTKIAPQDAPSLTLSPQQINFGNQALNTPSTTPITATLGNEGSAALAIQNITAGQGFTQTNNCGDSLAGGGSTCQVQISFTPAVAGLQTDEISITDNSPGSPHSITVSGIGVLASGSLSVLPTSLSFPAQPVYVTSTPQTIQIVNNGTLAVTISNIQASGFFEQTNTCGTVPLVPLVLNVGASCTVTVTFTPQGSGSFTGSLAITSDAASGAKSVALSGTGIPQFTLSASERSTVLTVGTKSTTFTVGASAPTSFVGSISLACSATGASSTSCAFNPTSIQAGQSSTVTVNGLSASTASPLNITVTGTYTNQTSSIALTIFLADFSLAATPVGVTVTAGNTATYTITATPTNDFNQGIFLSCANPPQGTICYFTPAGFALNGTTYTQSTLQITTTAQSKVMRPPPPRGGIPPGFAWWALMVAALALITGGAARFSRLGPRFQPHFRLAVLLMAVTLVAFGAACENYYNPINITPVLTGTPSGNFTINIVGTLGNNPTVTRGTTINLEVAP